MANVTSTTLRPSKAPNLPIGPVEYSQQYQDQHSNALRLYFNEIDNLSQIVAQRVTTDGILFPDNTLQTTAYIPGAIEAYDLSNSIALTSTPTVIKPANYANANGISYDSSTGIFTLTYGGPFNVFAALNTYTDAANQYIYIYSEINIGSGWIHIARSGRVILLKDNNAYLQVNFGGNGIFPDGAQIRYYMYSNDGHVSLKTETLPTASPTVYVPAIRIQYAGG